MMAGYAPLPSIGYRKTPAVVPSDGSDFEPIALPRFLVGSSQRPRTAAPSHRSRFVVATVLLPFAAGYFLGHVYRGINALISADLAGEFTLAPTDLGVLSAVLFLAYGFVQLPLGAWLDRSGPKRVQIILLSVAALGAFIFAGAQDYMSLLAGRILIGVGIAGALMAGLKAIVVWFPTERFALANGCIVMLGALGAAMATVPAEFLIREIGWRGLFIALAALTAATALAIAFTVPEQADEEHADRSDGHVGLGTIYRDAHFWRIAPLSAIFVGSAWALQGLWAGPWLTEVAGLERQDVVAHLLVMALAFSASALLLGAGADMLRQRGIAQPTTLGTLSVVTLLAQVALVFGWPVPTWLPWIAIAAMGAGTVLSYAIVTEHFPRSVSGRATAALNLLHVGAAFAVQVGFGIMLQLWPAFEGNDPAGVYQAALAGIVVLEASALLWFAMPRQRSTTFRLAAHPVHAMATTLGLSPETALRYAHARQVRCIRCSSFRRGLCR